MSGMTGHSFRIALVAFLAVLPVAAGAQSALKGHDTQAPIDIDAQRIEVRDRESQAIFSGAVKIRQARMSIDAASVRVFYERGAGNALSILRVDAQGGVSLASPSETANLWKPLIPPGCVESFNGDVAGLNWRPGPSRQLH